MMIGSSLRSVSRSLCLSVSRSSQIRRSSVAAARDGVFKPKSAKDVWTGDAGAYPVMVGIGWCLVFAAGFGAYYFLKSPDVRVIGDSRVKLFRGELEEYKRH